MKTLGYVLILFALLVLGKLSYDSYNFSRQLSAVQTSLHNSEQKNANLNDQLVALQRQTVAEQSTQSTVATSQQAMSPSAQLNLPKINTMETSVVGKDISASMLLKQQLKLIQFALQQHQFVYALEQMNQFDSAIEQYHLADTLKKTLHQSNARDKAQLQDYVLALNTQQAQLDDVLNRIDQSLTREQQHTQLAVGQSENKHFWQSWFQVDRVTQQPSVLAQRRMVLKEVQLRILLARQALLKGQYAEYQMLLQQSINDLERLPDQYSQSIHQRISHLKQTQLSPVPKLSSAAMLEQ